MVHLTEEEKDELSCAVMARLERLNGRGDTVRAEWLTKAWHQVLRGTTVTYPQSW